MEITIYYPDTPDIPIGRKYCWVQPPKYLMRSLCFRGDKFTQYLIGGGYHQEGSVFPGSFADKKPSFHVNLGHLSPDQKFTANLCELCDRGNNLPVRILHFSR
jgi:hypothetical protein